jgi:hypothetical protein
VPWVTRNRLTSASLLQDLLDTRGKSVEVVLAAEALVSGAA